LLITPLAVLIAAWFAFRGGRSVAEDQRVAENMP
jgi:hypothetical protein